MDFSSSFSPLFVFFCSGIFSVFFFSLVEWRKNLFFLIAWLSETVFLGLIMTLGTKRSFFYWTVDLVRAWHQQRREEELFFGDHVIGGRETQGKREREEREKERLIMPANLALTISSSPNFGRFWKQQDPIFFFLLLLFLLLLLFENLLPQIAGAARMRYCFTALLSKCAGWNGTEYGKREREIGTFK